MKKTSDLFLAFICGVHLAHDMGYYNAKDGKSLSASREELNEYLKEASKGKDKKDGHPDKANGHSHSDERPD